MVDVIRRPDATQGIADLFNLVQGFDRIKKEKQQLELQAKQEFRQSFFNILDFAQKNPKQARIAGKAFFSKAGLDPESVKSLTESIDAIASSKEQQIDALKELANNTLNDPNIPLSQFPDFLEKAAQDPNLLFSLVGTINENKRKARQDQLNQLSVPGPGGQIIPADAQKVITEALSRQLGITKEQLGITGQELSNVETQKRTGLLGVPTDVQAFNEFRRQAEAGIPGARERLEREIKGTPQVSIDLGTKKSEFFAKQDIEDLSKLGIELTAEVKTANKVSSLAESQLSILKRNPTDALSPFRKVVGGIAKALGGDIPGFTDQVQPLQALQSLGNRSVIEGLGGSLSKSISDADVQLMKDAVSTISNDANAANFIIRNTNALAGLSRIQKDIFDDVAKKARTGEIDTSDALSQATALDLSQIGFVISDPRAENGVLFFTEYYNKVKRVNPGSPQQIINDWVILKSRLNPER